MLYKEVEFTVLPVDPAVEILIAELGELPFDSFEETEKGCLAYIPAKDFNEVELKETLTLLSDEFTVSYIVKESEDINWNEEWEKNYDAVEIAGNVRIYAPFHEPNPACKFNIIIEPKMSFGTAHHPTTAQMIMQLLKEDVVGKSVMDMGSGTAVLAVLAKQMGAAKTDAIDNDEWAFNNALENVKMNSCDNIGVFLGDATWLTDEKYEVFIANINRNILLNDIHVYAKHMTKGATLLLSGFYESDIDTISEECAKNDLTFNNYIVEKDWVSVKYIKG